MDTKNRSKAVPAAQFTRNFGRYRMQAQREAVPVSSHGEITGYFIAAEEYQDYARMKAERRSFAAVDMSETEAQAVAKSRMHRRHNHLNKLLKTK
jgi:hypothetical protein